MCLWLYVCVYNCIYVSLELYVLSWHQLICVTKWPHFVTVVFYKPFLTINSISRTEITSWHMRWNITVPILHYTGESNKSQTKSNVISFFKPFNTSSTHLNNNTIPMNKTTTTSILILNNSDTISCSKFIGFSWFFVFKVFIDKRWYLVFQWIYLP